MSPSALHRYRAERLLRKGYSELRGKVLAVVRSQLGSNGITLDRSDLEDCYSQALQGLYATVLEGTEVENPAGWLVTVTFRRAIDERRAEVRRRGLQERSVSHRHYHSEEDPDPDSDMAGVLDDRTTLRQVFEGLRSSLSPRECEAASLCYLQGLTRPEAAERMGIREARMHKLMDGASGRSGVAGKMEKLLSTIKAGEWCEQQSSLMRAYAFSILDPDGERYDLAAAHLRECPACRAHVASLRGLAAVLPPLPLTLTLAGGSGAAAGTTVGSGGASATAGTGSAGTGAGWIGGMGSLAAKLAVVGVAAVGAGFALHGNGAHGSAGRPARRSSLATPSLAGDALSRTLFAAAPGHVGTPRPKRSSIARRPAVHGAGSTPGAHSAAKVSPSEFSPERVHGEAPAQTRVQSSGVASAPVGSSGRSARATGEFGFE